MELLKRNMTLSRSYIILSMSFIYLTNFFLHADLLLLILAAVTVLVFFVNVTRARAAPKIFSLIMFIIGMFINISMNRGIDQIVNGIVTNVPLLTLIMMVPLLSIPLKEGGYLDSVHDYMNQIAREPKKIFASITFFLFSLGPVLNLGSIRLLHEILKDLKLKSKMLAKAYLSGFSTVILWSPYFGSVALVLYFMDLPVSAYIPVGLPLAFFQLIIGNIVFRFTMKDKAVVEDDGVSEAVSNYLTESSEGQKKKILKLAAIIIILMFSVLALEYLTHWSMMFLVSMVSILFPAGWAIINRKGRQLKKHLVDFREKSVPSMSNEIVMFISAGIFGQALTGTVVADAISSGVEYVSSISFLLFAVLLVVVIVLLTFMGIHPIVIVIPLIAQIDPQAVGMAPQVIALVFMLAWSISAVSSPVNPLNLLVSGSVKSSSLSVGVRWNGIYLLSMFVIGLVYIYILNRFIFLL